MGTGSSVTDKKVTLSHKIFCDKKQVAEYFIEEGTDDYLCKIVDRKCDITGTLDSLREHLEGIFDKIRVQEVKRK
jgi:hypothetical protein